MAEKTTIGGPRAAWKASALAGVGGVAIGAAAVAGYYAWRAPDRAATEQIVHDYIVDHGEILQQAYERLQQRQASAAVGQHRAAIETPYRGAWAGNEHGDVTLVEFFDYACGYCRASNADVDRLLREDPGLKVVWRELPVLGADSQAAAYVSLGAARQNRFRAFHDSMFAYGRPTDTVIGEALQQTGVQREAMNEEGRTELGRNFELARALGANGTPTFVVGDEVMQGAVGYEALKEAIAAARSRRS